VTRPVQTIVVAYHGAEDLDHCLAAVGHREVTVVDNSSSPDVRGVTIARNANYIDPGRNSGFAAAVNLALRDLDGVTPRDVLLLNPDAVITSSAIDGLAAQFHAVDNERVAALSPRLVGADGHSQRVEWPFPSPMRAWAEAIGMGDRIPGTPTFVIGAALLLRWEALREVGLFDERYFLYAEEVDWQRRAQSLGWTSAVSSSVTARHLGAGTSSDLLFRELLFHAAHETYIRKWHGAAGWTSFRTAACLGAAGRAMVLRGQRRAEAARRARIYLRGPRRSVALARN
jgi:GT2 family glycosyltransferase